MQNNPSQVQEIEMHTVKIGEEFMLLTRYKYSLRSDQQLGLSQPPLHRRHPLAGKAIPLSAVEDLPKRPLDFHALVTARESVRNYGDDPISLTDLSWMLWATQGVKQVYGNNYCTLRTVPSAGARHPIETYLAINRVDDLETGLYQYLPLDHAIAPVGAEEGIARRLSAASLGQEMPVTCAACFIWTAVPYRSTWRYGQRGYRYMHLDAGHVCQNLYLAAGAIGCGCCAIGAFDDDAMAEALMIDPAEEFVIYLATVGRMVSTGHEG
jgi:SagB-type dehydrogenase family enzyme